MQDWHNLLAKLWGTCEEWFFPFILGCAIKFGAIMASHKLPTLRVLFANSFFGGAACVVAYHFSKEWKLPLWMMTVFMISASIIGYTLFTRVNKRIECKIDQGLDKLFPLRGDDKEKSKDESTK